MTTNFSSNSTTTISMPQFDAATGTLICVNAKVFLTSVVRMRLENDEVFNIDYTVRYQRKDTLSGPGIDPSVAGSRNKNYGPYSLEGSDGEPFSGPDYVSIGPDTIYNNKLYEATTSDVSMYLGTGTVDFFYKSVVNTFAIGSDVYALAVTSTNRLTFTMTYSYCNTGLLSSNIQNFQVMLKDNNIVNISWVNPNESKYNTYEIEVSENGTDFYSIGSRTATVAEGTSAEYNHQYHIDKPLAGILYFRIKQIEGKMIHYSEIRAVRPEAGMFAPMKIYPNPVLRDINLEFDTPMTGDFTLELVNQTGQIIVSKRLRMNNSTRVNMTIDNRPAPGIYYLRARQAGGGKVYSGKLLFRR
jgi:hypothetical protein